MTFFNQVRLAAMLFALGTLLTAAQGASPVQYDQSLAIVEKALTAQAHLLEHAPAKTRDTVPVQAVAAKRLSPFYVVQSPGGYPQPVSNGLLVRDIARSSALHSGKARAVAYVQAAQQIALLRQEITSPSPFSPMQATRAVSQARAVLSSGDFASDPYPPPSLLDRFMAWLNRLLSRMHGPSGPAPQVNPQFIKGLLIVLASGAFALLVWALVRYLRQRPRQVGALALDDTEAALMEARDADSLCALAEEQAGRGEWRRAFRLTYLATLVTLDTSGVLHFDRARTNWEYLRALRAAGRGDLYAALSPFTREFDRVWYGVARATAGDYAYARAQFETLQATSASAQPAPVGVSV